MLVELLRNVSMFLCFIHIDKIICNKKLINVTKMSFQKEKNFFKENILSDICRIEGGYAFDFCGNLSEVLKGEDVVFKISKISQLEKLGEFVRAENFKRVLISFGEIARTVDLQRFDVFEIASLMKNFCVKNGFEFIYSTPSNIEKRDFDRVFELALIVVEKIAPDFLEVNDWCFLEKFCAEKRFEKVDVCLGKNIFLFDVSENKKVFFKNRASILKVGSFDEDLNHINNYFNGVKKCFKIFGNVEIACSSKCLLKTTSEENGIFCKAPCACGKTFFAEKSGGERYPFISDGFCCNHFYDEKVLNLTDRIKELKSVGIDVFEVDLSAFDEDSIEKIFA